MEFQLAKSGTLTECRHALNAALAGLDLPVTADHFVVRAACNKVVEDLLDPLHTQWQLERSIAEEMQRKGSQVADPAEPVTAFAISVALTLGTIV